MRRYTNSTVYSIGQARGASKSPVAIREAVATGAIKTTIRTIQEGERIDTIAGEVYGDSTLWWVIAAASGIGWSLQVPPGTRIVIPDLEQVSRLT